jgi:monofunctional biosynthetic peptidoglycan transglycosylase
LNQEKGRRRDLARRPGKAGKAKRRPLWRIALRWLLRGTLLVAVLGTAWIALYAVVAPPTTPYMLAEGRRLDGVQQVWVPMEEISPHLARAVVAAEDANFCLHAGFDMDAIRAAIADGMARGGSTISQQVVKNAFLWQGRSWARKALEGLMTPVMELIWTKRRVLEVYLNIVEFDEGVFGAEAAAQHYFGISAADLNPTQAARLAAVLPNPRERDAASPTAELRARAARIADGAATILADGRDDCFAR